MDTQSTKINKSDGRRKWYAAFCRGKEDYRQGYDVDDFPLDLDKMSLREWVSGWWTEKEKNDVDR